MQVTPRRAVPPGQGVRGLSPGSTPAPEMGGGLLQKVALSTASQRSPGSPRAAVYMYMGYVPSTGLGSGARWIFSFTRGHLLSTRGSPVSISGKCSRSSWWHGPPGVAVAPSALTWGGIEARSLLGGTHRTDGLYMSWWAEKGLQAAQSIIWFPSRRRESLGPISSPDLCFSARESLQRWGQAGCIWGEQTGTQDARCPGGDSPEPRQIDAARNYWAIIAGSPSVTCLFHSKCVWLVIIQNNHFLITLEGSDLPKCHLTKRRAQKREEKW